MPGRRIVVEFLGKDKSLGRTADGVEAKTSRLGARMRKVGVIAATGLAVGTVLAAKALVDMGKSAAEDEKAQKLLARTLKNSAHATDAQVASTEDWITAQGKALGVADDDLRPALQRLAEATGSVSEAQGLTSLAMDVSAGTGKSLKTVSEALAKAQMGQVGALSRYGIRTRDAQGKLMSFEEVTKSAAKTFKGQATESANTLEGKMGRLSLAFSEAKESIGAKLLPVAYEFTTWAMDDAGPAVSGFVKILSNKLGPVIETIRDIFSGATGGMSGDVSRNLGAIKSTFRSTVSIISTLWARFGGFITTYVTDSLKNARVLIGGVLQVISGIFKVFSSLLKGDWKGAWDGIKQILRGALQVIKGLVMQGLNVVRTLFKVAWSTITGIVGAAWTGIKSLVSKGAGAVVAGVRAIPGKIGALRGLFRNVGKSLIDAMLDGIANAAGFAMDIAGNIWGAVKDLLNGGIDKINSALEFTIHIPAAPDVHINPANIPHLARGGIVKARPGGVLAKIAEGGHDEMVVPLSGPHAPRMSGGGTVTHVVELRFEGKLIQKILLREKRLNGGLELGIA